MLLVNTISVSHLGLYVCRTKLLSISMLYAVSIVIIVYGCNTVTHQQLDRNTSKSVTDVNSKSQQCIDRNISGAIGSRLVSSLDHYLRE